jgi:hypothetical protein
VDEVFVRTAAAAETDSGVEKSDENEGGAGSISSISVTIAERMDEGEEAVDGREVGGAASPQLGTRVADNVKVGKIVYGVVMATRRSRAVANPNCCLE